MKFLKAGAFILAWAIKIVSFFGLGLGLILVSPILIGGWAMDKTFGSDGW